MSVPVFAPLYHLRDNACWPTLTRRQGIPPAWSSASATQPSALGLGLAKAACRLLTHDRVTGLGWDAVTSRWSLAYQGESGAYTFSGDADRWHVARAASYHLALAGFVDALVRGRALPATMEVRARWLQLLSHLRVLAGPPPYDADRLAQCAQDPPATFAMMGVTDALYFVMKARAAEGLLIEESSQAPKAMPPPLPALVSLLWDPPSSPPGAASRLDASGPAPVHPGGLLPVSSPSGCPDARAPPSCLAHALLQSADRCGLAPWRSLVPRR